ncbi:ABC transporter substrate-binding protein [Streptomyces iconiensis]|uniref:ABC transporter substrate-binding protein n=1 Tax=Streptomyces iconiensis TaxID=1384038 RepID=A0ABT7A273_9ACTN|nr:ABC transporter substrate-binding protein [Streptomyces iconiensis]MDJ1135437.1 ABC transporter substrate-binding protein [Streptomyces iconiensis]
MERARVLARDVNADVGSDPVRIGIVTPLSEPGDSTAGELVVRGACLGAEYVREHGGARDNRAVELVLYDDQATAAEEGMFRSASAQMTKLALVDDVVAVMGQWHLRTTPWVVDVATKYNVPIFVENGYSSITAQKRSNVFRSYFSVEDRVPLMLDFAAVLGLRTVGMVCADTAFGIHTGDVLEHYGRTRHGMEFLRLDYEQDGTPDFDDLLGKVRDYQPDLLINGGVVRTNYQIMHAAAKAGLLPDTPLMVPFSYPLRSNDFWRLSGAAGVGAMWPAMQYRPSWPGMSEIGRWFTDRYRQRYGEFPPDTALTHFTDVTIVAAASRAARSTDRADMIDAMEAMEFPTWRGPIRYERGPAHWHHASPDLVLLQYQKQGQGFDESAIVYPQDKATAQYVPVRSATGL